MRLASCANALAIADRYASSSELSGATGAGIDVEAIASSPATSSAMTGNASASGVVALRIAIVDPQEMARDQLRLLLEDLDGPPVSIALEAGCAEDLLSQVPSIQLDAVFLDIAMLGGWEIVASDSWCGRRPEFVIVSAHREYALKAFDLEAADYLTKPVSEPRLLQTLLRLSRRRSAGGSMVLDPREVVRALSERQRQIIELLDSGRSNKEIARILGLSHFTVRNRMSDIFRLFGVTRRSEIVVAARILGFTPRLTSRARKPSDPLPGP